MEAQLLLWIHARHNAILDALFVVSHFVGGAVVGSGIVLVMVLRHRERGEPREALVWLTVGLYAVLLGDGLKWLVARPRPALWPSLVHPWGYSFPSGHALTAAALLPLLAWEAARAWPRRRGTWYALAILLTVWHGVGRLYLGVHWPTDVLAGWTLGAIASIPALYYMRARPAPARHGPMAWSILRFMSRFPDGVRVDKGAGGLARLVLPAAEGEAHVFLHGAHVAHFQPKGGRPVLMMSSKAQFEAGAPGKAIRGGVPICFPWFGSRAGDPAAPLHGLARLLAWSLEEVTLEADGRLRATLALASNEYTRRLFAPDFALRYEVVVGASLEMALTVKNAGAQPLTCEVALHSYFAVSDARQVAISGLEGATYLDKTDDLARKTLGREPITITRETDRVFVGTQAPVTLADPGWQRRIVVSKSGSSTTIVWNPWIEKAKAIADLGDDDWHGMVCIETANAADNALTLAPGASHTTLAHIDVQAG